MAANIIDEAGDLTVEITQTSEFIVPSLGELITSDHTHKTAQFLVRRSVLTMASQVLLRILVDPKWQKCPQSVVPLGDGHIAATKVWLSVIHKVKVDYDVPFEIFWFLTQAIDYFELLLPQFYDFCATWYDKHTVLDPAKNSFPTWRFNHAKAFARCTRQMAYNMTGHIMEKNPTKLYNYHLPPRIIQQLNAAKGRLRTVLHRGLFEPCESMFRATCSCRNETLYDYQNHLYDIGVWPLETIFMKHSMSEILERLDDFSYEAKPEACLGCRKNYQAHVEEVASELDEYIDGLCLDCLDRSKAKLTNIDKDYWSHHKLKETDWVNGCRFRHKQPTWYFSYMGRKEDRDRMLKERSRRRRHQNSYGYLFDTDSE